MEKIPYNYIGLLAFVNFLKYENVRCIKKEVFDRYRDLLLKRVGLENNDISFDTGSLEDFNTFLDEYNDIVRYENDYLILDEDVSLDKLEAISLKLKREEDIDDVFEVFDYQRELLNILGVKSIYNMLKQYWVLERKIEDIYMNLDNKNEMELKKYLLLRGIFLLNFKNCNKSVIDAIKNTSTSICFGEDDFDYDEFPIDFSFFRHEEYFLRDKNSVFDEISDSLFWIYQYAVFGDSSLSSLKLWKDIDYIYMNELDDEEVDDVDFDDEIFDEIDFSLFDDEDLEQLMNDNSDIVDPIFYYTYIDKIDEYMLEYGNDLDLLNIKKRLIYTLDKPELCLYKNECLVSSYEGEEELNFDRFKDEARYMAGEVFLASKNKFTVRKLLFLATYYELSKDEGVKEIMDCYSDRDEYKDYKRIVFGKQKNKKII